VSGRIAAASALAALLCTACAACAGRTRPPLATVPQVDIPRFMGAWYVIASIPTRLERGAHNAVESYQLSADGTIATTFRFNAGGPDGPLKTYHPRGFIRDRRSNAVWGMRFVWPIKADYRIIYLDPGYTQTIIGRTARDYVWIMARTPQLPAADYERLRALVAAQGYDVAALQPVPQR
jgi:apolipoprotein D and lipocalin family protein